MEIEAGDGGERNDRGAETAIGYRRRIGDERKARCFERAEAEPDQHGCGDGNRRAEAGSAFEEGAETKGDEEKLQAAVVADPADRTLQHLELARVLGKLVEKNDVEDDPADGQQPNPAPYTAAMAAICGGMPKASTATEKAAARPSRAAMWARTSKMPIAPSSTTTGMAATAVERTILPKGS
jgi:hypothetical protein